MNVFRCLLVFIAALVILSVGFWACGGPPNQPAGADSPTVSSETPGTNVAIDDSLTTEEYIRLGLPTLDHAWSTGDMVQAQKALTSLVEKGYRNLPRYGSQRSGDVFAKLTSPTPIEQLKDRATPFESRIRNVFEYLHPYGEISKLYLIGFLKKEVRGLEMVEFMGLQLRLEAVTLEMLDEYLLSVKKDDPLFQTHKGLDEARQKAASRVRAVFRSLSERNWYETSEHLRLVDYMQDTIPRILPRLPTNLQVELIARLKMMNKDATLVDLQPALSKLFEKTQSAVEKGKTD